MHHGRSAYIGPGPVIDDRVEIHNNVLVYGPTFAEEGVSHPSAALLTSDLQLRAINLYGSLKSGDDWGRVGVTIETGAAIGAHSVCGTRGDWEFG